MWSVRSAALANYVEVARQFGLDPYLMLRRVGIDAHALTDSDMRLSAKKVAELLEASAEASQCHDFGLQMAQSRKLSDLGAISLLISHQPTLRSALEAIVQYRNLLNSALALQIEDTDDLAIIREELAVDFEGPKIQSYELAIGVMARIIGSILGPRWRPVSVHLTHARPKTLSLHRKVFGEHLEFESEFNGLVCLKSDLERPNPNADPNIARYAAQFVDSFHDVNDTSFTYEVRKSIYLLLPSGGASLARIARSLGLNERTLQRRLAAEKAEFSDLVNSVRHELTERYLANKSYSLTRVAEMLGYGQLSSFTRWFIGEFGVAPSEWRRDAGRATPLDTVR
jgi:AraC-like DNA-binding protein